MTSPVQKLLICDDHDVVREGLKLIVIAGKFAFHVGEAANGPEALEAIRRESWDILILDINLGATSGLEVLKQVTAEFPLLPVLILSAYPEEQFAVRAMRAGARGYLNKTARPGTLLEAIRQVLAGKLYISSKVAEELAKEVRSRPGDVPPHTTLSDREDQALRMIGAGRTVGEIAVRLSLSVKTVSSYRAIVLKKLALKNNAQLMRYALEHGLHE